MNYSRLLPLLCCFCILSTPLRAQQIDWVTHINYSIPDGSFIWDVDCLDSLRCVFVKSWGIRFSNTIFRTLDGGIQWNCIQKQDSSPIGLPRYLSVAYPTENIIMVCGDSGTFLRTTNGGSTWTAPQIASKKSRLLKIQMINPQYGIIHVESPYPEYLLATADSGKTWDSISVPVPLNWGQVFIESAFAPAPNILICAMYWKDSTTIGRSSDRGKTWNYYPPPGKYARFYFIDSLNGWMTTGGKTAINELRDIISRTYDGGITWHTQLDSLIQTGFGISDLSFADSLHGLVVGSEKILRTTDGGKHWKREFIDTNDIFNLRVSYKPGSNGVVVHTVGRLLRYVGHTSNVAMMPQAATAFHLAPNPTVAGAIPLLSFQLLHPAEVRVSLLTVTGEESLLQPEQELAAGLHQLPLLLEDQPAGLLFVRVTVNGESFVRPIQMIR